VRIRATVEIEPRGKRPPQNMRLKDGRMLHGVKDAATRSYETRLAVALLGKLDGLMLLEGPLQLDILAIFKRPKKINKAVKAWCDEKGLPHGPNSRVWCPRKPDIDNIRKSVQDAMKTVWRDDAQVVAGLTLKAYGREGERPSITIALSDEIQELSHQLQTMGLPEPRQPIR